MRTINANGSTFYVAMAALAAMPAVKIHHNVNQAPTHAMKHAVSDMIFVIDEDVPRNELHVRDAESGDLLGKITNVHFES